MNLETETSRTKLFNINTGKATSDQVAKSLLGVPEDGRKRHEEFVKSCAEDPQRFEQRITKPKLLTFSAGNVKSYKSVDNKMIEMKCTRDLMGRFAHLATKQKLDLKSTFAYPLIPVPFSMASSDGCILKTDKASLRDHLEAKSTKLPKSRSSDSPTKASCLIIDGQFLLHVLPPNILGTYGDLARSILISAMTQGDGDDIRLLFDDYPVGVSLKSAERERRGCNDVQFSITGPRQKRPTNLRKALASESFKRELPLFLVEEWKDNAYCDILGDKKLYVDIPGMCFLFETSDAQMKCEKITDLCNNHLEADTKVCLHAIHADQRLAEPGDIIIRASDTDIMVILLHHQPKIRSLLWMDVGLSSSNTRRYISITKIHEEIGDKISAALPAFHAYSGSDFTSCFFMKAKVRPFEKLMDDPQAQGAFSDLTCSGNIKAGTQRNLQKFTAKIYGCKNNKVSLNEYRYMVFDNAYRPKENASNQLEDLSGMNASLLPPCESELTPKLLRVRFIARMWTNAHKNIINTVPSEEDGFKRSDNGYEPVWHEGAMLPPDLNMTGDDKIEEDDKELYNHTISSSDESDDADDS